MYIYVFTFLFFHISRPSPNGFTERQRPPALLLKFIWERHPKRHFCPAYLIAPAKGADREMPRKRHLYPAYLIAPAKGADQEMSRKRHCPFRQPTARVCKGRKTKKRMNS